MTAMTRSYVTARRIKEAELDDVAACFETDPAWAAEFTADDTEYIVDHEVEGIRLLVPPSDKPTEVFALYMDGCDEPLFAQVRDANGVLYEPTLPQRRSTSPYALRPRPSRSVGSAKPGRCLCGERAEHPAYFADPNA